MLSLSQTSKTSSLFLIAMPKTLKTNALFSELEFYPGQFRKLTIF